MKALANGPDGRARCWWGASTPDYQAYHDEEWGRPVRDERGLYERMVLEGFQSGLSWLTILRKRENFRAAFRNFDIETVASFGARDVNRLLGDAGIVRHRGKIESTVNNAKRALELAEEHGSLRAFFGRFRADRPFAGWQPVSAGSKELSRELKRRGWTYVGPTTMHAFLQAVGLVNDHADGCDFRAAAERARARSAARTRRIV